MKWADIPWDDNWAGGWSELSLAQFDAPDGRRYNLWKRNDSEPPLYEITEVGDGTFFELVDPLTVLCFIEAEQLTPRGNHDKEEHRSDG